MEKKHFSDRQYFLILAFAGFVWFGFRLSYGTLAPLPVMDVFVFLFFAPIAEEMFFRGVVQDMLKRRVKGGLLLISYANILTSVFFALVHIPFWGVFHSVLVFIPSLAFGFLFDRTGRLYYSIILHLLYNLNVFIV